MKVQLSETWSLSGAQLQGKYSKFRNNNNNTYVSSFGKSRHDHLVVLELLTATDTAIR